MTQPRVTRRAACDRCRSQKLRCVRVSLVDFTKCQRCENADTPCHYSIAKPAGRPAGAGGTTAPTATVGKGGQKTPAPREVDPKDGTARCDLSNANHAHHLGAKDSRPESAATRNIAWTPALWEQESSDLSAPAQTNDLSALAQNELWPVAQDILNTPISDMQNMTLPVSPATGHQPWFPLHNLDAMHSNEQERSLSPDAFLEKQDFPMHMIWEPHEPRARTSASEASVRGTHTSAQCASVNEIECNTGKESKSSKRPHSPVSLTHLALSGGPAGARKSAVPHTWMQQFSEFNMQLYHLASASWTLRQDNEHVRGQQEPFPTQFAGRVVDISSAFLKLLNALSCKKQKPSRAETLGPRSKVQSIAGGHDVHSEDCCDSDDDDDFIESQAAPNISGGLPGAGEQDAQAPSALNDMSTLLQILACYLRLRQLHSVLYEAIHHYLTTAIADQVPSALGRPPTPLSDDVLDGSSTPPILRDLHIGGVSLANFQTFQVKFVLQIIVHTLGEVEILLGLPTVYRVSKKSESEPPGLLKPSISSQLLKTLVQDHNASNGRGADGNIALRMREQLAQLRGLLRGSINL